MTYGMAMRTGRVAPQFHRLLRPADGMLFALLALLFMSLPFEPHPAVTFALRSLIAFLT